MEIKHHVSLDNKGIEDVIKSLGLKYTKSEPLGNLIVHFDIIESDPRWKKIDNLIKKEEGVDIFDTFFTREEILASEWNRLRLNFLRGYPQPENSWEELTYENECSKCGTGYRQRAPFRIKEPRMGKNDFLQLFWTNSVFCTTEVIEVLKNVGIKGIEIWPAIIQRTKQASPLLSQLVFPFVTKPGLSNEDKLEPDTCLKCSLTKYAYHQRGYMQIKQDAIRTDIDGQVTYEWFGNGGMGFQEILISNRISKLIIENGWKGVELKPIQLI